MRNNFTRQIEAVAVCKTPYKQKFGVPRQPGLVEARGTIELINRFNHPDFVEGIEQYSHLWILFSFHENHTQGYKAKVRPPRLGGNDKLGVFATRSAFRPNGIGQSVVKLHNVINENGRVSLEISDMDLVDGTPVLDIKPYIPYSDSVTGAEGGMAREKPELKSVEFSDESLSQLRLRSDYAAIKQLIQQVLAQDPRPAYKQKKQDNKSYFISLNDLDIEWRVLSNIIRVKKIHTRSY